MKVAVIPARGGSKRIAKKNIRPFFGKPIMAWSVEAARASGCFDRIIVSTDDAEIAAVARSLGAEVPFTRPAELATDQAATIPVVAHAINWLKQQGEEPEQVCCIYAAAPFISAADIQQAETILRDSSVSYVFPVASFPSPVQRALRILPSGRGEMFNPELFVKRSQELEEAYHDAAQFYWGTAEAWLQEKMIFSTDSVPLVIPRYRVQDIDTEEDWQRAEYLFRAMQEMQAFSGTQG